MLPRNPNNLLFRKPLLLHCPSPLLGWTERLTGGRSQRQVTVDQALYAAKEAGRNQVTLYSSIEKNIDLAASGEPSVSEELANL